MVSRLSATAQHWNDFGANEILFSRLAGAAHRAECRGSSGGSETEIAGSVISDTEVDAAAAALEKAGLIAYVGGSRSAR